MSEERIQLKILIHDGYDSTKPIEGDPWILINLSLSDAGSGGGVEVRCDRTLDEISPDIVSNIHSIRDSLKKSLSDKQIEKVLETIVWIQSGLLIRTAQRARENGVVDLIL